VSNLSVAARVIQLLEPSVAERLCALSNVDQHLDAVLERARQGVGRAVIGVDIIGFLAHVVNHAAREENVAASMASIRSDELLLAFAAATGDPGAQRILEVDFIQELPFTLSRGGGHGMSRDEVLQQLRVRLLVGGQRGQRVSEDQPARPKLLDYAGRGPLGGWLRVAATRISLDAARRTSPREVTDEALLDVEGAMSDPELAVVRARHAGAFNQAFRDALDELADEERNLLRLRLVDDLNIDELAAVFHIHRATAARRLQRTREALEARTRQLLEARLGLSPSELTSLIGAVRSYLDLSVGVLSSQE
jgi:RNA polymerase sigma-70 factor (ECF subfamily)